MLLKYFCPECSFYHIEDFKQGEFMLEGLHEVDCPFSNIEVCVNLKQSSNKEYKKYLLYLSLKRKILNKLKNL